VSADVGFPAEAVVHHADVVSETSHEMAQARAAASEVTMDSAAYGHLCQFLPVLLSPLFGSAAEVMRDAVDGLEETALKLRATASDMAPTDAHSARRLNAAAAPSVDLPL
jgi:hypothetical protein